MEIVIHFHYKCRLHVTAIYIYISFTIKIYVFIKKIIKNIYPCNYVVRVNNTLRCWRLHLFCYYFVDIKLLLIGANRFQVDKCDDCLNQSVAGLQRAHPLFREVQLGWTIRGSGCASPNNTVIIL